MLAIIVIVMKFLWWGLFLGVSVFGAALKDVHSVYVSPMSGGLDQHIAHQLTEKHVFQVVADPKLADAVITDSVGEAFLRQLEKWNKPVKEATPAERTAANTESTKREEEQPRISSFQRGRGTVFLVDAKSKQVIWSLYSKPKNTSAAELNRTAGKLVAQLSKTLNPAPANRQ